MWTHKYQKYLLTIALRDLFLMQFTQAEIILSFRPNYIPYISGASWGFSQLLQFLEGCSSSVPISLLLPRSIIICKRTICYQSSHCMITCKLGFLSTAFCAMCDRLPSTIWVLLKGGNHWGLPRIGYHTQEINSQLSFSSDGGIRVREFFSWLWAIIRVRSILMVQGV